MSIDYNTKRKTKLYLDSLVKPQGSLGMLEEIAIKIAGITGKVHNNIDKRVIAIFSSDNGIWDEGVASAPQSVTASQTLNFVKGITAIPVISKANNCDLKVYDVGIKANINHRNIINRVIRRCTSNMLKEDAMSIDEAKKGIEIGIECVKDIKNSGYQILGIGEMGIANTSTSSCVVAALTACNVEEIVGRGGGLTDSQLNHKKEILAKVMKNRKPDRNNPMDVLHKVGGFDIAAMVGACIGAKKYNIPIVIDGFISMAAALIAYKIDNETKEYMFASHNSTEKGYNLALDEIGLKPMLNLNMRLGEGSGCPIAINIINTALQVVNNMATFEKANIDISDYQNMWDGVEE